MPNNLTTVAQTLLEKIKDTNVAEHKPSDKRTTQLNYEQQTNNSWTTAEHKQEW